VPGWLATGDPVAAFNSALMIHVLVAAFAMYLLIADWTRLPAAGLCAALLYAFATLQVGKPYHVHHADNAWMLLALFFARRVFAHGRWRDGAGLGAAVALQAGVGFYPLLAAAIAGAAFFAWLLWHHRGRPARWGPLLLAIVIGAGALAFVTAPYLAVERAGGDPVIPLYARWASFLPGRGRFFGWVALGLALAALALGRARSLEGVRGDPRVALAVAVLLLLLFAAGGNHRAVMDGLWDGTGTLMYLPNPLALFRVVLPA